MVFISLLAQRNEPKKEQPFTWPANGGLPCESAGSLKTREVYTPLRGAQTV
jgi:hypothetical protein